MITGTGRLWDAVGLAGLCDERIEGPTGVSESGESMRFLFRFIGEHIRGDCGEDSSVDEAMVLEVHLERLLRSAADDELGNDIPVFCRVLDRWVFEV